jgi:deoxyribodipyrimidine photolyase
LDVFCLREPVSIEWTDVEDFVEAALKPRGGTLTKLWGAMSLFHEDDLPFQLNESPDNYSALASALGWSNVWSSAEREACAKPVRKPICAPTTWALKAPSEPSRGALTDAVLECDQDYFRLLGFSAEEVDTAMKSPHGGSRKGKGGETAAWARLNAFIDKAAEPERNDPDFKPLGPGFGAGGAMYLKEGAVDAMQWKNLSKPHGWAQLSKYLACGCITPREIYHTLSNLGHWALPGVVHRLMWREWYRFGAIKHHRKLAWLQGPGKQNRIWIEDPVARERWKQGKTGVPYIDACMRELNETGWLAYKGRKTAASFLAHDLRLDWRIGAFHMEEVLLDYDFAMNYGNWVFCARVDKDYYGWDWHDSEYASLKDTIRTEAQSDTEAAYVKHWVPELKDVPTKYVHTPWMMTDVEADAIKFKIGQDYPEPLIPAKRLQFLAFETGEN